MAFGRKPRKEIVKVEPAIPHKMALENGAANLLDQIRRDHQENIKMCSDLVVIRNWMEKAKADKLKDAMDWADQFDFWTKKIDSMLASLQDEPQELTPAVSQAKLTDESNGNRAEPAAIEFLAKL